MSLQSEQLERYLSKLREKKPRVMFVDDDPTFLLAVQRILQSQDIELYTASTTSEAMTALETVDMAAVVSDHLMPGGDGTDFLAKVATRWPETVRIMLTGHATTDVAIAAINRGEVHRFVEKPLSVKDLILIVREALQHQHVQLIAQVLLVRCKQLEQQIDEQTDDSYMRQIALDELEHYLEKALRPIDKR